MRAALLIVLGLVVGILGTALTYNALHQRTPLPRAVMTVMAYHMGQLKQSAKAGRCDATTIGRHLERLQSTASDVPDAFKSTDPSFLAAATKLQKAADDARAAAPTTCAALTAALAPVGQACQSCHQQFR